MNLINIGRLDRDLTDLGVTMPAPVADVQATRAAINSIVFEVPTNGFLTDLAAGKLDARNVAKAVRTTAVDMNAHAKATELARDAEPTLAKMERRALAAAGDEIIEALRGPFDAAAADASVFVGRFGSDPRPEHVLAAEGGSEAWQRHQTALGVFDRVRRIMASLGHAPYFDQPVVSWYLESVTDGDSLRQASSTFTATARGPVDLIAAGFRLRLNTADEARALVAGVQAEKARQTEAAAQVHAEEKARRTAERRKVEDDNIEQAKAMRERVGLTS